MEARRILDRSQEITRKRSGKKIKSNRDTRSPVQVEVNELNRTAEQIDGLEMATLLYIPMYS